MTILVADDEKLARFQLKSILCAAEPDDLIIYEATNGVELVEHCRLHRPDIAFVDIRMPQLDGLSAIEQCKVYSNDTEFVITSVYSDFSFAQKSIALQVAHYLLKPVEAEEITALMQHLRKKLHDSRCKLTRDFSLRVMRSFQLWEEVGLCPSEVPNSAPGEQYYGFRFYLDCLPDAEEYRPTYLKLNDALQNISQELASQRILSTLYEPKEAGLDFIVCCGSDICEKLNKELGRLCRSLSLAALTVSCIRVIAPDLWSLFCKIKDAADREEIRFGAANPVCALESIHYSEKESELLFATRKLVESFQESDEAGYDKALNRILEVSDENMANISLNRMASLLGVCMGGQFQCKSINDLARQLKKHRGYIYLNGCNQGTDKITYTTQYVEKHYMEGISVVVLAEKLQLTPNYFSKIFHERVGMTFSDYITDVRIKNARRILMTSPDVKVRDVAIMVGYYSPRHFSNIFRRLTGCNPSDYRSRQLKEQEGTI